MNIKYSRWMLFICLILVVCQTGLAAERFWSESEGKATQEALTIDGKPIQSFSPLVKMVAPGVVNISTIVEDPKGYKKYRSLGSGFLISANGYILTNNHLVEKANDLTVTTLDKEKFVAKVVGTDPKTDIALIKIDTGKKLPSVSLGDSDKLEVGDFVIALGNPFGLGCTVTAGIVTAKERVIGSGPYDDFIQTDASINPGNSGGPLFNLKGEVVGINTAVRAGGQDIDLAMPIQIVKPILGQMVDEGKETRGWLGVYIKQLTPDMAKTLNFPGKKGALVADVTKDGPAEKAGIRSGDVIASFDGKEVSEENQLPQIVASTKPGKKVDVVVIRDGRELVIPILLMPMPNTLKK